MGWGGCAEFGQDSVRGFGVEESDEFAARAVHRGFVDELATGILGLRELVLDVVGGESDVMDAAVGIFFEKLGDGTLGRGGFEEFEMGFADVEEGGADFLAGDFLDALALQAESLLVVGDGVLQRPHRNTEMVNALQHGLMVAPRRRAGKD